MKCLIVQPIHAAGLARLREAGIEPVLCPDRASPTIAAYIPDCQAVILSLIHISEPTRPY